MKSSSRSVTSFRNGFCMKHVIRPERFEREVFWRCVHDRGAWLARMILMVHPGFFRRDLALIREIGGMMSLDQVKDALQRFHKETQESGGFLRRKLKVRLSGERLLRLTAEILL
jgi:hypothetical protein